MKNLERELWNMASDAITAFNQAGLHFNYLSKGVFPKLRFLQNSEDIRIEAVVAGYPKELITVEFRKNVITIAYDKNNLTMSSTEPAGGYYEVVYDELKNSSFIREIYVDPTKLQVDKIEATIENGILTIVIPRVKTTSMASTVRIPIK